MENDRELIPQLCFDLVKKCGRLKEIGYSGPKWKWGEMIFENIISPNIPDEGYSRNMLCSLN